MGLFVTDMERSLDFYQRALGMKLRHRHEHPRGACGDFRSAILGFGAGVSGNPGELPNICGEVVLEVTERKDILAPCIGYASPVIIAASD